MSLIKNSFYNIVGFAIPTMIAIPSFGILARWLSIEEFGIFMLTFALVGYASIFDAGLSRAVIREISIFRFDEAEKSKIIGTASIVIFIMGLIASSILFLSSPSLADFLKVSDQYKYVVIQSFKVLSIVLPCYLLDLIWIGYLQGIEKFSMVNVHKSMSNSLIILLPVIFCIFDSTILYATYGLVTGRIISVILSFLFCKDIIRKSKFKFNFIVLKRLLRFGSWLTVSNIISPMMVYFDKFLVSNLLGSQKVAYYIAPAEGVNRLVNVPIALTMALFPKINHAKTIDEQRYLERMSYIIISSICLPITILGISFSREIMTIWMGVEYGIKSSLILQILFIGYYFNSLAQIPYTILQSKGFSKTTAIIHAIEVIPYLTILYFSAKEFGLIGAATVWSLRVFVDFLLLLFFNHRSRNLLLIST